MNDHERPDGGTGSSHRRILSSVAFMGMVAISTKLVALGKDLLVARQLGAGDALDAYLVALVLPSYAAVVLAHTFASAFVPAYVRLWRQEGLPAARAMASGVLICAILVLSFVTLAVGLAAPWILPMIGTSFDEAKLAVTQSLFFPMAGIVLASGLSAVFAALLNAHERFAAAALAPLAVPLVTAIVFWTGYAANGVRALAFGTALGFVSETAVVGIAAWQAGLVPWPRWPSQTAQLRRVGLQYVPVAVAGLLMSSAMVVDQAMAASLGSGQVSVLNYAGKVVAVVLGVIAASLSTVLFPHFTHLIAAGRMQDFGRHLRLYSIGIVLLSIPMVVILVALSETIVRCLFERGAFTPNVTAVVSGVQRWLLLQIPFYVLALLGARVLSALDGNAAVLRIAAINVVVNVVGDYVLMRLFGVNGIAMATTLMYITATATTLFAIRFKLAARQPNPFD